jgi:probable F420-dependent oxidoreductase
VSQEVAAVTAETATEVETQTPYDASHQDARPVRVGVQIRPQHTDWRSIRQAAVAAEELGVDVVFTWDHFYPLFGPEDGAHFECYTILAALAEVTERVEIGALVTCNSYRNPDLLADMSRTIDHISGGRFILGIGSGWKERDYVEYGYEFGTAGGRLDQLGADLPRIENRLGQLNPPPTRHIPVLIGGGGEKKTLRLVARHADIWHCFGDPQVVDRKVRILDNWCAVEGRDPSALERSAGVEGRPEDNGQQLLDLGFRLFTMGIGAPDFDLGQARDWLAFRDEVNAGR